MRVLTRLHPALWLSILLGGVIVGCSSYGEKLVFNKGEVYYMDGISASEATDVGKYLVKIGLFDGQPKSVQLRKKGERYVFRVVISDELVGKPEYTEAFKVVGGLLSSAVFSRAPVDVELTDEHFKTKKEIPFEAPVSSMGLDDSTTSAGADTSVAGE